MNRKSPSTINNRRGSSYLEVQVAMVLLSIGIGGLYSLSVIQTRQSVALERMLPADEIASINPVADANPSVAAWAQKLGAYADIQTNSVAAPQSTLPLNVGFERIVDNEDHDAFYTYAASGGDEWQEYGGHPNDNEVNVAEIQTPASYGSFALFIFQNVPPGEYELLTFVPQKASSHPGEFGAAVPHYIYDSTYIATVMVDQRSIQQDHYANGRWWERLGVFTFTSGTAYVLLYDTPKSGDWLVADAVMLRCRRSLHVVAPVATTTGGGATVTVELN